jgi:redox-sensitive bicupin YhaK (pirin superfamily)
MQRSAWQGNTSLLVFDDGDQIKVHSGSAGVRFLFISGKPIREPVAWYGPIVMNTESELRVAFEEYQNGTFLKKKSG